MHSKDISHGQGFESDYLTCFPYDSQPVNGELADGEFSNGELANGELANGELANGELANGYQRPWKKPSATQEFQRIEEYHPVLASTGCSSKFCQSGRMIHTDEHRVGKDRPIHQIEAEAISFLDQMRRDNLLQDGAERQNRVKEVLEEINQNARVARLPSKHVSLKVKNGNRCSDISSDGWTQTNQELEYGIRLAWKYSRKCIMRSQYEKLRLCDLRHVRTSVEMGKALLQGLKEAFNRGDIQPTAFVFPARHAGENGPLIWNQQLLAFAGYTNDDGSILGDPMNASLTTSIIDLGWNPPKFRTKWDLLPLVTMAEGDAPFVTGISAEDFPLIHVRHPRYELPFDKLGLRWVPAPALSQLGFDIGGVQYTASPFVGWFMDAEIGIRDLADESRYNVLPDVVRALYPHELHRPLGQLPESERLNLLCRAQTELNFAVFHSFSQNGVRMSDSLTASSNYCQFDDEHFKKHGFRLPADPYWLAPPQGSIVPIWHRGGAPHYQPKPLICRHRGDPVKTWKRRQKNSKSKSRNPDAETERSTAVATGLHPSGARVRVMVCYCSAGTTAAKLAGAVHGSLQKHPYQHQQDFQVLESRPLDSINWSKLSQNDVVILIASSTGRGDIPLNGQRTAERLEKARLPEARFAIFGNGDSSYFGTFNGAARILFKLFKNAGLRQLNDSFVEGDNAKESPPWKRLDTWLNNLPDQIINPDANVNGFHDSVVNEKPRAEDLKKFMNLYACFALDHCPHGQQNLRKVTISSSSHSYSAMDYLVLLAPSRVDEVHQVIRLLRKKNHSKITVLDQISYFDFLRDFVQLEDPFRDLNWAEKLDCVDFNAKSLVNLPVADAIRALPSGWHRKVNLDDVLISMPTTAPRFFSIASTPKSTESIAEGCQLELIVQTKCDGKFSERYLNSAKAGDQFRARIQPATQLHRLCNKEVGPIVAFVTGSGFAPMQSLLRLRAQQAREADQNGESGRIENQISLFVGFRSEDTALIHEGIDEAVATDLFDMLFLMPSNGLKARVQDKVFQPGVRERVEAKIRDGAHVFVCANRAAATDVATNLNAILGCDVRRTLGDRYIQDTFDPSHQ